MTHKSFSKKDIADLGERYLTVVNYPGSKGVWLRFTGAKGNAGFYTEWFSVPEYGTMAKAKSVAKKKRDQMLLSGDALVNVRGQSHLKKKTLPGPPELVNNSAELVMLHELFLEAEKSDISTIRQLRALVQIAMHEGKSVVDIAGGDYSTKEYSTINSMVTSLSTGKTSNPGLKLVKRGTRSAKKDTSAHPGRMLAVPILLSAKGKKAVSKLLGIMGGNSL